MVGADEKVSNSLLWLYVYGEAIGERNHVNIGLQTKSDQSALVVEGEIDHSNVGKLGSAFRQIAGQSQAPILLDLSKVTYVDSAGLSAIYELAQKATDRGPLQITGVSPFLWRVLEVAGLTVDERVRVVRKAGPPEAASDLAQRRPVRTHGPQSEMRVFPPSFDQLTLIRDFVEEVAADSGLDLSRAFDLKVAVSEASANAIEHGLGDGNLEVSARRSRGRLTVTVSHPGSFRPRADHDPARAHRGMGLPLMLALTNELTVTCPNQGGTSVSLSVFLG
jgi:anti-anti-sigma factor